MSIATSIDALAVGVTFAFLPAAVSIFSAVAIIGSITFILSFAGVAIGKHFGARYKERSQIAGGLILIAIGIRILVEHLPLLWK